MTAGLLTAGLLIAACGSPAALDDAALATAAASSASVSASPSAPPASASGSGVAASPGLAGMTLWQNQVSILYNCDGCSANPHPISFSWDGDYSITPPQPWTGVQILPTTDPNKLLLQVGAGRKGSAQVAAWFNARAPQPLDQRGTEDPPSSLNFAFTGTLTLNGQSFPIVLAQGYSAGQNLWFIGGPGWTYTTGGPAGTIALQNTASDGSTLFLFSNENIDEMFESGPVMD